MTATWWIAPSTPLRGCGQDIWGQHPGRCPGLTKVGPLGRRIKRRGGRCSGWLGGSPASRPADAPPNGGTRAATARRAQQVKEDRFPKSRTVLRTEYGSEQHGSVPRVVLPEWIPNRTLGWRPYVYQQKHSNKYEQEPTGKPQPQSVWPPNRGRGATSRFAVAFHSSPPRVASSACLTPELSRAREAGLNDC